MGLGKERRVEELVLKNMLGVELHIKARQMFTEKWTLEVINRDRTTNVAGAYCGAFQVSYKSLLSPFRSNAW